MSIRPAAPRALRDAVQPMIAGAVLATTHPNLAADSIEIDHIDAADGVAAGLRIFLYHPAAGLFEQWVDAIGATYYPVPQATSRPGEVCRTATGRVGATLVEVTAVTAAGEWTWRTSAGRSVHARDHTNSAVARCGRLITGTADPAHWDLPGYRCAECVDAGLLVGAAL